MIRLAAALLLALTASSTYATPDMLAVTNADRTAAGLVALIESPALDAFAQCNFDLRVQEDITIPHRNQIVACIKALTEHLERHHLDRDTKINVIDEVETWAQRITEALLADRA